MESLTPYNGLLCRLSLYPYPHTVRHGRNPSFTSLPKASPSSGTIRLSRLSRRGRDRFPSLGCFCNAEASDTEAEKVEGREEIERPPFDLNLAVILAGFAFEAYWSPPEILGKREVDAADCHTVYLSGSFLREIYDGQLFVKLKNGFDFPAMDPWGTSDPYVVLQLDNQVVKSKVKWGTKSPTWNEELTLNVGQPPGNNLQVAAWDANLVTPHKRMGNAHLSLDCLCDGNSHEVLVELEGMGGGGRIQLELKYKSYNEIEDEKKWWRFPFVSEFLRRNGLESGFKNIVSSEAVPAGQFVRYAFGHLKAFSDASFRRQQFTFGNNAGTADSSYTAPMSDGTLQWESSRLSAQDDSSCNEGGSLQEFSITNDGAKHDPSSSHVTEVGEKGQFDKQFWKSLSDIINQNVVQKFGFPVSEKIKWDGFDLLSKIGSQSQRIAEAGYIESGLATPEVQATDEVDDAATATFESLTISAIKSSLPDIKKATQEILRQTDSILGALMVLSAAVSQPNKGADLVDKRKSKEDSSTDVVDDVFEFLGFPGSPDLSTLSESKAAEVKTIFSTAESAMEAWAMLATSAGHPTFIKSEFEKLCFLDNPSTDTQVAIWRDSARGRLVIAFRGTEQARWKDLRTDLMLVPAGLNPERIGGDFRQEVQVHSGFLSAYDSVRTRILSLIELSVGFKDNDAKPLSQWHVYVTGHSLGGALATLLALELSSSQLLKHGAIFVTMYNFGSPRVGNKRFVEVYNEKVKDSWRVVNHRDIIPTVPRLMGYCHVAQPIYLAAGNQSAMENVDFLEDGYQVDVIGESTPDVIVSEFMKGEKELIEKILQTEINIFRSIRDGTALMQHMEDFYYITLLENVRSNYQSVARSQINYENTKSIG